MNKRRKVNALTAILAAGFFAAAGCGVQRAQVNESNLNAAKAGAIQELPPMLQPRASHTATLLQNGKVLLAGGFEKDGKSLSSAEIFDPSSKAFAPAGEMAEKRLGHTAALLPDGRVLIAGGFNGDYLDSAEIFDPKKGKFFPAGKLAVARSEHTATMLADGRILLAGGVGKGWTFLADAEIYDPATNSFTKTGKMTIARESHTATLLNDGQVLITGGHQGRRAAIEIYSSAEVYDPKTGSFAATSDLTIKRHKHGAVLLRDGRVLIVGGSNERDGIGAYKSTEVYDPSKKRFSAAGDMKFSRYKLAGTTILLKNGKVLIAGGANKAEIFDPSTNTFAEAAGSYEGVKLFASATQLPDGGVLIAGGYGNGIATSKTAWLYKPQP